MANIDHYKDGKWVGTTKTNGHADNTGWQTTYLSNGETIESWVANTDTFDYKPKDEPSSQTSNYGSERMYREVRDKVMDKIYKPLAILGILIVIINVLVGVALAIHHWGLQEFLTSVKELFVEINLTLDTEERLGILSVPVIFIGYKLFFRPSKEERRKQKLAKKNRKSE